MCYPQSRMKPKKRLKNQPGFSVVEVLVALGLFAVIATGVASLIVSATKQQKGIQAKDQQRGNTSDIRVLLSAKPACFNSFGAVGNNPTIGFSVTSLKDAASVARYSVGSADKTGMLQFEGFEVGGWIPDPVYPLQGRADLKIKLSKVGDTGTVKNLKSDLVTLKIKINASNQITECYSIGTQVDGFWQPSPSNSNDIFYDGGNVGIGTAAPLAKLDVKGGKINGELNCRLVNGPTATAGSIALCAVDEYVTGGGGGCETLPSANPGFLHLSRPTNSLDGWIADCYRYDYTVDVFSTAYAICCKK